MSYNRSRERNRRLKKLAKEKDHLQFIACGAYYNIEKHRIVRLYRQPIRAKFYRREANKAVRRQKGLPRPEGAYRKVYYYWYNII